MHEERLSTLETQPVQLTLAVPDGQSFGKNSGAESFPALQAPVFRQNPDKILKSVRYRELSGTAGPALRGPTVCSELYSILQMLNLITSHPKLQGC
jgi:hypothetical protein